MRYVERFATTRAKLRDYLRRKLRERGWKGDADPDLAAIADQFAEPRLCRRRGLCAQQGAVAVRRAAMASGGWSQKLRVAGVEDDGRRAARGACR